MLTAETRSGLTLVLGVDGSGKSTFLNGLKESLGYAMLEPTSTPAAKQFKKANTATPLDTAQVNERENIFLDLNKAFDHDVSNALVQGQCVATSGNALVTRVSHNLMRQIINDPSAEPLGTVLGQWAESDALKPGHVALIYAPDEVIRERIQERQDSGDETEVFWGFNSPYFLARYQEEWQKTITTLGAQGLMDCSSFDSSHISPEAMIKAYGKAVTPLLPN